MDLFPYLFGGLTPVAFGFALMVGLVAGIVKGIVGFALPVILISGLSTIMAPEVALAALILPTLVANVFQALRQGVGAAWASVLRFRVFLGVGGVMMVLAAQFVLVLPETVLFLIIGVPVVALAVVQLSGWVLNLQGASQMSESIAGAITGVTTRSAFRVLSLGWDPWCWLSPICNQAC